MTIHQEFEKLLNPDILKNNLLKTSLYLTAFEILNTSVEQRVKTILCWREKLLPNWELKESEAYKAEIKNKKFLELGGKKNIYYASCTWLRENKVISDEDFKKLQNIRKHRNLIAHQIPKILVEPNYEVNEDLFQEIQRLLTQIEKWWLFDVEFTISHDRLPTTEEEKTARTMLMILLDHIIEMSKN